MASNKRVEVEVAVATTGDKEIDRLLQTMRNAGQDVAPFEKSAQALGAELQKLRQQQQLIEQFIGLKKSSVDTATGLQQAQQRAQELGRALAQTEAPTKKQVAEFERARKAVGEAKQGYEQITRQLQDTRSAMANAGVETSNLARQKQQLTARAQEAQAAAERLKSGLRSMGDSAQGSATGLGRADTAAQGLGTTTGKLRDGMQSVSTQLAEAKNQLLAFAGVSNMAQVARDVGELADQWVNLQARLKLSLGAQTDITKAMADTEAVAMRTYASLDATANLYGKIASTGKEMGVSQQQALALTQSINQSIQLSGASAQASEAAVTQFTQGLQSGVIRGDEFNSIMEQAPRLAKAMADGLNVPIGALRGLAEQGKLTSDKVIRALQTQSEVINQEFGSLPLTIGRAVQNLQTEWLKFVGTLDQSSGASATVATGIDALSKHLDDLARVAAATGAVLTAAFAVQAVQALRAAAVQMAATGGAAALLRRDLDTLSKPVTIAIAVTGFEVGYQIGEMLRENSALARQFGVGVAEFLTQVVNDLKLLKEAAAAVFTSDTVDAALDRYIQRNIEIGNTYRQMYVDAEQAPAKIGSAADTATSKVGALGTAGAAAGAAVAQGGVEGAKGIAHAGTAADEARTKLEAMARAINTKPAADSGLKEVIRDLENASLRGEDLDLKLRKNLPQALENLSGPELSKFRAEFIMAMDGAKRALEDAIKADKPKAEIDKLQAKVDAFEKATRTGLGLIAQQAAKNLGVDVPLAFNKVSDAFKQSQDDLSVLIRSLPELKVEGVDTAAVVGQALNKMIDGAQNEKELEAIRGRVQALRGELGEKIADGLLDQAKKKSEALKDALDAATPGINSVREAFKTLGIESDAVLKEKAKTAKEAYDAIKGSGTASAREINESWKAMAEASIKANDGVADSTVKAQAKAHGFAIETDAAGKSVVKSLGEAKGAAKGVGDELGKTGEKGKDALGNIDYAAQMAGKSMEELEKITRKNWDANRDLADQAAESNAAANESVNAWQKQQQEQNKYYGEMIKILQKTRMGFADMNNAAWAAANALEALDKQQQAIERSSGGAAEGVEDLRVRLAELDGDEDAGARRRAERDKAEVKRKMALVELELQRAMIRKDDEEAARLSQELQAFKDQLILLDQIAAKEAQQRQEKARQEKRAAEERKREEQARAEQDQDRTREKQAAEQRKLEEVKTGTASQSVTAAPSPTLGAPVGTGGGTTYVSNINIDGRRRTVGYADRQSQQNGEALIRELAIARGVAQ